VLSTTLAQLGRTAVELSAELDKVRAVMKTIAGKPGPLRIAFEDIQSQLAHLIPPDLMRATPASRLVHIVRYLKAIQVRLQRLPNDPQKDQHKAAQVTPLWQSYWTKLDALRARGRTPAEIAELGWLLEEIRVQTFAPELKTAVAISAQRLDQLRDALR
jgi:ATP-dependent helicase HrpA